MKTNLFKNQFISYFFQRSVPHEHLTGLTAIWGQLVWYDISYTLPISGYADCCSAGTG